MLFLCLLVKALWTKDSLPTQQQTIPSNIIFLFFSVLLVMVSFGTNSRGHFVAPLACLFLGLLMQWLYGFINIRIRDFIALSLAIVFLLPLATDIATAMVMVRGQRTSISASQLFARTLDTLQDKESIQDFRIKAAEKSLESNWSEKYVDNLFLARFANAKFPDNALNIASSLTPDQGSEVKQFQLIRLLSQLPTPVLSLIGVPQSEKLLNLRQSHGDKLYGVSIGRSDIGGMRSGHFFGTGMAGFGYGYLIIFMLSLLLIFPLLDSLCLNFASDVPTSPVISILAITQFVQWLTFSNSESVVELLSFPFRDFVQLIVLFAIIRWILSRVKLA